MFARIRKFFRELNIRVGIAISEMADEALGTTPAAPKPVVTYELPGAPPTGSRIRTRYGHVFRRGLPTGEPGFGQWGEWHEVDGGAVRAWGTLLLDGPLTLLDDDEAPHIAALYGPKSGRWGDPEIPCPWRHLNAHYAATHGLPEGAQLGDICALGIGHTGPHRDARGWPLGMTQGVDSRTIQPQGSSPAAVTREDLETLCMCGHPAQHRPGCPRWDRMAGPSGPYQDGGPE